MNKADIKDKAYLVEVDNKVVRPLLKDKPLDAELATLIIKLTTIESEFELLRFWLGIERGTCWDDICMAYDISDTPTSLKKAFNIYYALAINYSKCNKTYELLFSEARLAAMSLTDEQMEASRLEHISRGGFQLKIQ